MNDKSNCVCLIHQPSRKYCERREILITEALLGDAI